MPSSQTQVTRGTVSGGQTSSSYRKAPTPTTPIYAAPGSGVVPGSYKPAPSTPTPSAPKPSTGGGGGSVANPNPYFSGSPGSSVSGPAGTTTVSPTGQVSYSTTPQMTATVTTTGPQYLAPKTSVVGGFTSAAQTGRDLTYPIIQTAQKVSDYFTGGYDYVKSAFEKAIPGSTKQGYVKSYQLAGPPMTQEEARAKGIGTAKFSFVAPFSTGVPLAIKKLPSNIQAKFQKAETALEKIPYAKEVAAKVMPYIEGAEVFGMFAPGLGSSLIETTGGRVILRPTETTLNYKAPTFRTFASGARESYPGEALAPKQTPRIKAFDLVKTPTNEFIFAEKIVVPRRFQYVQTPAGEYFGLSPSKTTYATPVESYLKSVKPIKVSTGEIMKIEQPALTKFQQTKPLKQEATFSQLIGDTKMVELGAELRPSSPTELSQLKTVFGTQVRKIGGEPVFFMTQGQEASVSNILSRDIAKVKTTVKPRTAEFFVKPIPEGKTTTSSTIVTIQKKLISTPTGELFGYRMAGRDTTFPFGRSKSTLTKGVSFVPSETSLDNIFKTSSSGAKPSITFDTTLSIPKETKTTTLQKSKVVPDILTESLKQAGISKAGSLRQPTIPFEKALVSSRKVLAPIFTPSKTKQVSALSISPKQVSEPITIPKPKITVISVTNQKTKLGQTTKSISLSASSSGTDLISIPREITIPKEFTIPREFNIPREETVPRETTIPREIVIPREVNIPREFNIPRESVPFGPLSVITRIPKIDIPFIGKKAKKTQQKKISRKGMLESLYIPQVKRRGTFITVGLPTTKAKAIRRGEFVTRQTASATFKVVPTKAKAFVSAPESYRPSEKLFRSYGIVKGKPVQLKDTFIQKKTKRIGTAGEKAEITRLGIAKRKAGRKSIW